MVEDSLTISYPSESRAVLVFKGSWTLQDMRFDWQGLKQELRSHSGLKAIALETGQLARWDSQFLNIVQHLYDFAHEQSLQLETEDLPDGVRRLLKLAQEVPERKGARRNSEAFSWLYRTGALTLKAWRESVQFTRFAGELTLSLLRLLSGRASFRGIDLLRFLQAAGPEALPIVSLIGVLVGAVLAFVGALQLQMFGAEIYVANLVGLGSVREMGAMMTAIIMAGRTGSAYAAQLGTMQVNNEIDALKTFGISVVDFLVLPRFLALLIMLPLLTLWADMLAIVGGLMVGVWVLDISLIEYLIQTRESMGWNDLAVGTVKSVLFAIVIAMSGCLRGLQSGRNSSAVGQATTSAMVTAILLIVIWDALSTLIFNQLGI
ncbi:MlaE family ABC transporter permease [Candidatus Thiodiazotropha sp. CDECU1]|uniref:MlaE family ABC transporter permease n=1 Tax=Candidatus Thiodiazotropha sp. CDECU1 TaxID=3065865 RepID=UPI00292DC44F|nr:ABC transporter permease [Candidatus Thiodiazotropha sp. CDECU1]